ncbi:unknown [Bacteroides sp. CAG:927]|nr:unknown [Bacteroides sp. CAG:927]
MADLLKIFYSKQREWTIFVSISLYLALCRFYLVDSRIFSIFVTVNRQRYEMC